METGGFRIEFRPETSIQQEWVRVGGKSDGSFVILGGSSAWDF